MTSIRTATMSALVLAAALTAGQASATAFTFTTTGANTTATSKTFTSNTVGGVTLSVRATAWHASDITGNADLDTIEAATLGLYDKGLGVIASGDNGGAGNLHQIDNLSPGVDFIMLQFNQKVTLSSFARNVFAINGSSDSDAAFWADTAGVVGTAATWNSAPNLATSQVSEKLWTTVLGGASDNTAVTGSTAAASVWLVGADFVATRNDGFKLGAVTVNYSPAVPEPATWGMMILGFGMVGAAARRTRRTPLTAAA